MQVGSMFQYFYLLSFGNFRLLPALFAKRSGSLCPPETIRFMKNTYFGFSGRWLVWLVLILLPHDLLHAFAYIFAETSGVDIITHPIGYDGTGGTLTLTVGIDPTSANATAMAAATQNVIQRFNQLVPTTGNLMLGASNDIPPGAIDFESTLLHELGHSLGLAHVNAASESGLSDPQANFTKARFGTNGTYDLGVGVDGIIGSADDVRNDDVNLHYFQTSNNDPFTLAPVVDGSTYSRDIADLPAGDLFPANADRSLGAALGYVDTEAVMQQGAFFDEAQRTLVADDVAGIRFAAAGLDEVAGTADDYTLVLQYAGLTTGADIMIDFDDSETGFAVSRNSGIVLGGLHIAITSTNIYFNTGYNWYFTTSPLPVEWLHFQVEARHRDAVLHWATSAEVNHQHYEVERSLDQQTWIPIAVVRGEAEATQGRSYQYRDSEAARLGYQVYYRLRQVDLDGDFSHSELRSVQFVRQSSELITFGPIPLRPHSYVAMHLAQTETVQFTVRDLSGRTIEQWLNLTLVGYQRVNVGQRLLHLPRGAYVLEVRSQSLQEQYKFVR